MQDDACDCLTWDEAGLVTAALKAGRPVVFPTDTVYGLGVAVNYAESPEELFSLKRRDPSKPIAWLIAELDDLDCYGVDITLEARALAERHWPGALTIVVKASDEVPPAYRSPQGTIGLRVPASEAVRALIREVGPLAASSANRSGDPAPTAFREIAPDLLNEVAVAVEDGSACGGVASSVIDATSAVLRQIRR